MYRRHLRMVLQDLEANRPGSEFVHRISSIPVVYLAYNIAAEAYRSVKKSNKVLNVSFGTTEKVTSFISNVLVKNFEKQLRSVDYIACRGLDTLENIAPTVKNKKEKLYRHTKDVYEDTVESGLKKYEVVKNFSSSKAVNLLNQGSEKFADFLVSPYGEVCEVILDFALECGEMYVDYYLPPLGDERPEKLFGDRGRAPVWKRAQLLRNRFRERLYKHTLLKAQTVKLRTKIIFFKIYRFNAYNYFLEVTVYGSDAIFQTAFSTFCRVQEMMSYIMLFLREPQDDYNV